jgi:RNA polymerase sigma factor (TIGR02999 family)
MAYSSSEVTQMLLEWSDGNRLALDELMPVVYDELHQIAKRYLRREPTDHTLQATALVNEAYLRLIDQKHVNWQNRSHFFAIAAQAMRRIMVDHARKRLAEKRGSGLKLSLDEAIDLTDEKELDVVALDDALLSLATFDPQQSGIVELRFFGGLSIKDTATVLGISPATVKRDWILAKAWLHREIKRDESL